MLARANRLTSGKAFAAAVRRGRRAGTPTVVLHLASRDDGGSGALQVGLVVGRTVGNAVVRNQVKRRLRHVARDRVAVLPEGAVLVIRALAPAGASSSATLARDVDRALERLRAPGASR